MRPSSLVISALALAGVLALAAAARDRAPGPFAVFRVEVGVTPEGVRLADLDGDGRLDLLVAGEGEVRVLAGDGEGGFGAPRAAAAGPHASGPSLGDVDGDGCLDVAVANHDTDYATLRFGRCDGGFESRPALRVATGVRPHPHATALADVDGDGRLDLLVDDRGGHALRVFLGDGRGALGPGVTLPVGDDPYRGMVVEDLDGDGRPDLAVPLPDRVGVLGGDGRGGFRLVAELRMEGVAPFTVAAGDVDGDGLTDLAASPGEGSGRVGLWLGRPGGGWTPAPGFPRTVGRGPGRVVVADVDGDGRPELAVTSWPGDEMALLSPEPGRPVVRVPLAGSPWDLAAGDLDGDGRDDVVVAQGAGTGVHVLLARAPKP